MDFESFILEKYGSNEIVEKLTEYIFDVINQNIGKIILNKYILIKNILKDDDINFLNDTIELKLSNRNYANINIDKLKIENDTIKDLYIYIEFKISENEIIQKQLDFRNEIKKFINHELNHLIERYLTIMNNNKYDKSWEDGKKLQDLKNKYPKYDDILYFIYLSLPHEIRSRVSHIHQQLKYIEKDKLISHIKNTKEYKDSEFLSCIDGKILLKKIKNYKDYDYFIRDFTEIFLGIKSKTYDNNFIKFFDKLKNRNKKMKSKLIKTSYSFLNESEVFNFGYGEEINIDYNKYK